MKFYIRQILTTLIVMVIFMAGLVVAQTTNMVKPDPFVSDSVKAQRDAETIKEYRKDPFIKDRWNIYGPNKAIPEGYVEPDPFLRDRYREKRYVPAN